MLTASGDVSLLGCNDYSCALASMGGLQGSAEIEEMQRAMIALSQAAGWPAANPGPVTGVVDKRTVVALGLTIAQLSNLSTLEKLTLSGAIMAASENSSALGYAQQVVGQYAKYLTIGIKALTVKYTKTSGDLPTGGRTAGGAPTGKGIKTAISISPGAVAAAAAAAAAGKYPVGTLTAFSPKLAAWRVAVPVGSTLGAAVSLGAAYNELAPVKDKPAGAEVVTESDIDAKTGALPFYKNWRYLVPIGGVVLAGAVATFFLARRRRR